MATVFCTNCGSKLVGSHCTICAAPAAAPSGSSVYTATSTSTTFQSTNVGAVLAANGEEIPALLLSKFSWGAFLLNWWWTLWNADGRIKGIAIACTLVGFFTLGIPSLVMAIYLGINGNRISARNRTFASLADFRAVQRAWASWGVGLLIVGFIFAIIRAVLSSAAHFSRGY